MTSTARYFYSILLFFGGAAIALAGCDGDDAPPAPASYAVGTTATAILDDSRAETETDEPGDHRALVVRTYYPATAGGAPTRAFLDEDEAGLNAEHNQLPAESFTSLPGHAALDAAPAPGPARFPVLLFSPGYDMPTALYDTLLTTLASRGYVVVAIAHPYRSGIVVFPDGRVAAQHERPTGPVEPWRDAMIATWSADQRFVRTWLEGEARTGRLRGRLDLDRVGVLGHSVGGAAAAETCQVDARFRACGDLDGSVGSWVRPAAIARPFLLLRADGPGNEESTLRGFFDGLGGVAYRVQINGGGHYTFSDLPVVADWLRARIPDIDLSSLSLGTLSATRGTELVAAYAADFFDVHVRDRAPALLDTASPYPEIVVDQRGL